MKRYEISVDAVLHFDVDAVSEKEARKKAAKIAERAARSEAWVVPNVGGAIGARLVIEAEDVRSLDCAESDANGDTCRECGRDRREVDGSDYDPTHTLCVDCDSAKRDGAGESKCVACEVENHDTCGMVETCPCCRDTIARRT